MNKNIQILFKIFIYNFIIIVSWNSYDKYIKFSNGVTCSKLFIYSFESNSRRFFQMVAFKILQIYLKITKTISEASHLQLFRLTWFPFHSNIKKRIATIFLWTYLHWLPSRNLYIGTFSQTNEKCNDRNVTVYCSLYIVNNSEHNLCARST